MGLAWCVDKGEPKAHQLSPAVTKSRSHRALVGRGGEGNSCLAISYP